MSKLSGNLRNEVEAYKEKLKEYESRIKQLQEEREIERAKPPKNRIRTLGAIWNEIRDLNDKVWRLKPKKTCSNCNRELNYDDILCWNCGEVFLDICPKCKSMRMGINEWGSLKCLECGFEYREMDLLEDLLVKGAEPNCEYLKVLDSKDGIGSNCYNIGIRDNTIWDLCQEYNCPLEKTCEYYCPAFLSVLALVKRGKVSIGLPWGYSQGGDLHGYKIRWKRPRRPDE